ncbi:MAG: hypothetical protein HKN33_16275, partial [Pyrinomonadaceae bacterium]|nr:hypothetical protein [Pyrinomonadaceae bacterium]
MNQPIKILTIAVQLMSIAIAQQVFSRTYILENKRNDIVVNIMRHETAEDIVTKSIRYSSGYNGDTINAEDTLLLVGFAEPAKLAALKRYLVRNKNFGVPSKYFDLDNLPQKIPAALKVRFKELKQQKKSLEHRFVIAHAALDGITSTSTVGDLIESIRTKSGIHVLPINRAYELISECRIMTGFESEVKAKEPAVNELSTDASRLRFVNCLTSFTESGKARAGDVIGYLNARAIGPDGNTLPYKLPNTAPARIQIKKGIKGGWTYSQVGEFLAINSELEGKEADVIRMSTQNSKSIPSANNPDQDPATDTNVTAAQIECWNSETQLLVTFASSLTRIDPYSDPDDYHLVRLRYERENGSKETAKVVKLSIPAGNEVTGNIVRFKITEDLFEKGKLLPDLMLTSAFDDSENIENGAK